jgi:SPOR domain
LGGGDEAMKDRQAGPAVILFLFVSFVRLPSATLQAQTVPSATDSLAPVQKENMITYERTFRPSEYDSSLQLVHERDTVPNSLLSIPLDSLSLTQQDTVQGFRIQVLSTDNYDDATLTRDNLNAELPDQWVYMVYDAPVYKIRVGDYLNHADANRAVESFVEKGYKDAWVVPDRVIKNPPPKPPFSFPDSTESVGK